MELKWVKQQGASNETVLALCRPKSEALWALGRDLHQFETRTAVLHGQEAALDCAFAVNGGLDSIATLADGSVLAAGEELSVLFDGDSWQTIRSGLKDSRRIWGAHPACANALTEQGLFYFNGRKWAHVDLKARGIPGYWADGDCDAGGAGWIVGTYETHSCMAAGSGNNWRADACGSWYLYRVHVGQEGRAFVAGGDGLWRHDGTRWIGLDDRRDVSRLPLALSAVGATAIVVAAKLRELGHSMWDLELLTEAGWQTVRLPIALDIDHLAPMEIDLTARLLIAHDSAVWVSSRLPCWSAG